MEDVSFEKAVLGRLDVLIMLLLDQPPAEGSVALSDKMRRLLGFGLRPTEVAEIVHRPLKAVTSVQAKDKAKKGG